MSNQCRWMWRENEREGVIAMSEKEENWEFLDNIHGVGFDINIDVSANGRANVLLGKRREGVSWGCEAPTRQAAYEWIGKKIEELIEGREELVPMEERV